MAGGKPSNNGGCVALIIVAGLVLAVATCSKEKDKTTQSFVSPTLSNQIEMMPSPAAVTIAPLSAASVRKARQHLAVVLKAEGLSGAMIYSQNCYDALTRSFSWSQLDQCGGFDLLAVAAADTTAASGLAAETEYFGAEAAAGRYLALATKAGQAAEEADKRLEALQHIAGTVAPPPGPSDAPADPSNQVTPNAEPTSGNISN